MAPARARAPAGQVSAGGVLGARGRAGGVGRGCRRPSQRRTARVCDGSPSPVVSCVARVQRGQRARAAACVWRCALCAWHLCVSGWAQPELASHAHCCDAAARRHRRGQGPRARVRSRSSHAHTRAGGVTQPQGKAGALRAAQPASTGAPPGRGPRAAGRLHLSPLCGGGVGRVAGRERPGSSDRRPRSSFGQPPNRGGSGLVARPPARPTPRASGSCICAAQTSGWRGSRRCRASRRSRSR